MNYQLEMKKGKLNVLSPKLGMYVMENATVNEVKIAFATEMAYKVKLDIVKLLVTFPHDFSTTDDEVIVHQNAVDEYEGWYKKTQQRIGFLEEYYARIDKKISEVST